MTYEDIKTAWDSKTTYGIDYCEYAEDYSEKSLKLTYKEYEDSSKETTVYIPKSQINEDGSLPYWWVAKQNRFPVYAPTANFMDEWKEKSDRLERFVAGLPELIGTEKEELRRNNIAKLEQKMKDFAAEVQAGIDAAIRRIVR